MPPSPPASCARPSCRHSRSSWPAGAAVPDLAAPVPAPISVARRARPGSRRPRAARPAPASTSPWRQRSPIGRPAMGTTSDRWSRAGAAGRPARRGSVAAAAPRRRPRRRRRRHSRAPRWQARSQTIEPPCEKPVTRIRSGSTGQRASRSARTASMNASSSRAWLGEPWCAQVLFDAVGQHQHDALAGERRGERGVAGERGRARSASHGRRSWPAAAAGRPSRAAAVPGSARLRPRKSLGRDRPGRCRTRKGRSPGGPRPARNSAGGWAISDPGRCPPSWRCGRCGDGLGLRRAGEAEVGGDQRQQRVQPYVVPIERQQPEQRVQAGDQAEHGQEAVHDRGGPGKDPRAGKAAIGGDAEDAPGDVEQVVERVHREQAQEVAVGVDHLGRRRRVRVARAPRR